MDACMHGMHLCIYLCLYVSMALCLYVSMSLCLYVFMFLCMSVSMSLCIYVSMSLCVCVSQSLCLFVSMSLRIYVSMCLCIYASMSLCIYVSLTAAERAWSSTFILTRRLIKLNMIDQDKHAKAALWCNAHLFRADCSWHGVSSGSEWTRNAISEQNSDSGEVEVTVPRNPDQISDLQMKKIIKPKSSNTSLSQTMSQQG